MKTRRQFLAAAATVAVALPARGEIPAGTNVPSVVPEGVPLFRFIQINDTHYQSPRAEVIHPTYLQANGRVHWLCDALKSGGVFPPVDFILHLGDMTHQHSVDRRQELRTFKALLDTLPVPTYTVVGNHDNVQGEGNPEKEAPIARSLASVSTTPSHKGVGFVVTDVSGTGMPDLPRPAFSGANNAFASTSIPSDHNR